MCHLLFAVLLVEKKDFLQQSGKLLALCSSWGRDQFNLAEWFLLFLFE